MTPERWRQIEEIFQAATDRAPAERDTFLDQVCAGDLELRREVESLLDQETREEGVIANAVLAAAESFSSGHDMAGRSIGPYKVIRELGAGGMGTVYLAEDTRLGRRVALKVLPAQFAQDQDRLRRFLREARAASAISHPNVITIFEVGNLENIPYIVTEFVDGDPLSAKFKDKPLSAAEIVDIALQVAEALETAHARGIIHRDIKPGNIMINERGQVKVLDFGLAKVVENSPPGLATDNQTQLGLVLGTISYMSPEQAYGKVVDPRSDLFSLGVLMYEMATGALPFRGDTALETIDRIVHADPEPITRRNAEIPWELERMIRKCLQKDPGLRYQSAREMIADLRNLKRETDSPHLSLLGRGFRLPWHSRYGKAVLVLIASIILITGWLLTKLPSRQQAPANRMTFTQLTSQEGQELFPSLSPDGKSFVYAYKGDIFWQRAGGVHEMNLTGDASAAEDTQPAFSPNGEHIAFRSEREGGGIFIMGATGESVRRITDFGYNPVWSPDGKEILCATEGISGTLRLMSTSQIWSVNVATGTKRLIATNDAVQPCWSPHGTRIAYWGRHKGGWRDIWTVSVSGGNPVPVMEDAFLDWNPVWSPDSKFLYFASDRGGSMNLWRVRIEEGTGKVMGSPEPVTTPSPFSQHLAFSTDGRRLAYVQQISRANLQTIAFDPVKETVVGQPIWITQSSKRATSPDLSPDGEWIAFDSQGEKAADIFAVRKDGTGLRQLTDDIDKDYRPDWSPDGKRIAFYSDRSGSYQVWTIHPDGSGLKQLTHVSGSSVVYPRWSPDGSRLAYSLFGGRSYIMEVGKPWNKQTPEPVQHLDDSASWFIAWSWSSNARKLAGWQGRTQGVHGGILLYSLESKQYERLTDFGTHPIWLSDDRRLLFVNQEKIYLVDSHSKKVREILSIAPHIAGSCSASKDDRLLYFNVSTTEADIWLMNLQ